MDIQEAVTNFEHARLHCLNLAAVHRDAGPSNGNAPTPGFRTREVSVNRGIVVMAVAGWQAFIQDIAMSLAEAVQRELVAANPAAPASGSSTAPATSSLALVTKAVGYWQHQFNLALVRYSTPGKSETRDLLKWFGFDPTPGWTWTQAGGRGSPSFLVHPDHACDVLGQWLEVRHAVAHGHADFSRKGKGISGHQRMVVLSAARDNTTGPPGLRLRDAEACVKFFSALARLTAEAASIHIGEPGLNWDPSAPRLVLGVNSSEL